ncbi:murein transglycosylase domain-containing protein [Pseudoalteromonas sp. ACER1]|jgi:membrane-bound lytic murein transglycosylase C|uniref:murein transglycosylase domain-containing protein n=1 Tax=Pseudoalteromonas TaxID=53246 RepID=UPI00044803A7|nr:MULTISPECIES: murein transglycosylase domain-containing protein [Pseudoalteromonas]EWH04358.1 murein transglycosylase [Pseudoalteromonas lipolytica SCSIO 04301]MCF2848817.1 murein transglycosylase domain-containing protein [Pseudoalteromonas sp. PAST1]MCF2918313.1 murein transglycosylase domain-containing protein [Pseudoalteromonas sp. Cn5-37]MCO7212242.1 murein transglycosylase domain-containing protein [Pseudoalteromonas sp. ACER1]MCO7251982.1 murein transglycosylase domain-containing pro|tara:strand:- start:1931 stop:3148 length:1218 start_codon:yes stop_codon:yes gene_type:complete
MHPIAKILLKIGVFANLTMGFTSIAQTNNEAEFEAFLKKRQSEFSQFEQQQKQEFEAFVSAWHDAQNAYLKQVTTKWQDPNLPSSKVWVKYSDDLNKRTSVNFESGEVVVELLNSRNNEQAVEYAKEQLNELAQVSVDKTLAKDPVYIAANNTINNKSFTSAGQSLNRKIERNKPLTTIQPKKIAEQTVLSTEIVEKVLSAKAPKIIKQKDRVTISYKLPANTLSNQAKRYLPEVQQQARRYNIEPALLLAIIHTESSFNPLARSPIPAFGLMQIVPTSAGKDVSNFLQGKPLLLSPEYLFQADNNVEAGSTYVHILSNRYFKNVRNEQSRIYMSIAAYNTGPGNVAKTLSGSKSLNQASIAANSMSAEKIYTLMVNNLPAQETRNYLQKVVKRTAYYQKQLKGI